MASVVLSSPRGPLGAKRSFDSLYSSEPYLIGSRVGFNQIFNLEVSSPRFTAQGLIQRVVATPRQQKPEIVVWKPSNEPNNQTRHELDELTSTISTAWYGIEKNATFSWSAVLFPFHCSSRVHGNGHRQGHDAASHTSPATAHAEESTDPGRFLRGDTQAVVSGYRNFHIVPVEPFAFASWLNTDV